MTLASKRLKIDLKQKEKAELSPVRNETADGTNYIIEPKQDNTKPMNEDTLKGMSAYSMSRPAKKIEYIQQVGRKGSAFPMVAQMPEKQGGMLEAEVMKNRAAGPQNRKVLENNPNIMQPDNKVSAAKFGQEKLMSSIASDPGIPSPQPTSSMSSGVGSGVGQATNATPPTNYGDMVQDQSANKYADLYAGAGSTPQTSTFGMYDGPSKALVGDQHKLPDHLKAKIEAAPGMFGKEPRGTKEEMAARKTEKRNDRVRKRNDKSLDKMSKKSSKIIEKKKAGKITEALAGQKIRENYDKSDKKDLKASRILGSREDAKRQAKLKSFNYKQPGMYGKNTKVTKKNVNAAERDDAAHMSYLKRDVNYDAKHGGSKRQMLNDEKHISKLAGDLKYDHKKKRKYDNV